MADHVCNLEYSENGTNQTHANQHTNQICFPNAFSMGNRYHNWASVFISQSLLCLNFNKNTCVLIYICKFLCITMYNKC